MTALRLARGTPVADKIVKMDGGYHGHADCLLVAAGSGAATLGIPARPASRGAARDTIVRAVQTISRPSKRACVGGDIAAVIVEPIAAHGAVGARAGISRRLRRITTQQTASS